MTKRLKNLENKLAETICIELTFLRKSAAFFLHTNLKKKQKTKKNKDLIFQERSNSLRKIVNKYGNIFVAGVLNMNLLDPQTDFCDHFSDLRDT